jgi:hypothetical protein
VKGFDPAAAPPNLPGGITVRVLGESQEPLALDPRLLDPREPQRALLIQAWHPKWEPLLARVDGPGDARVALEQRLYEVGPNQYVSTFVVGPWPAPGLKLSIYSARPVQQSPLGAVLAAPPGNGAVFTFRPPENVVAPPATP